MRPSPHATTGIGEASVCRARDGLTAGCNSNMPSCLHGSWGSLLSSQLLGPCLQHPSCWEPPASTVPPGKDPVRPQLSSGLVPIEPATPCPAPTPPCQARVWCFLQGNERGFVFVRPRDPTPLLGRWPQKEGTFQNSTCLSGFVGIQGVGGGSSFRSRRSFPTPRPQQSLRLHPHPQRQFQFTLSSSPWLSAEKSQKIS